MNECMKRKKDAWKKDPSIRFERGLLCLEVIVFEYYHHDKSHRVN